MITESPQGADQTHRIALVLSGGGARAAYQVGALRAVAELRPDLRIQIITGVSAGAINAVVLASHLGPFSESVAHLERQWHKLTIDRVYAVRTWGLIRSMIRSMAQLIGIPGGIRYSRRGLLDMSPLCDLLSANVNIDGIERNIESGRLSAVGLTATSYHTGCTVTFVQGTEDIATWQRAQRVSLRSRLSMDHVMASAAIPLVFAAVQLDGDYFGDGSVRQTAPLAPAIHLGAAKILAVSMRGRPPSYDAPRGVGYPSTTDLLAMLLHSIFLDALDADAERLERINRLLERVPSSERSTGGLRPVDLMMLRPSEDLGGLARNIHPKLPALMRPLLRSLDEDCGPDFMSYLLFDPGYIRTLIELGYRDTLRRQAELEEFLDVGEQQT